VTSNRTQLDRALNCRSSFPAEQSVKIVCCHHDLFVLCCLYQLVLPNMSVPLSQSARQLVRLSRRSCVPRSIVPVFAYPTSFAGPSTIRSFSTTSPTLKKATKTSKASKAVSRQEVENVDYEDADLDKTLSKVGTQMEKAVNWAKALVYESVERGRGRVSPCKLIFAAHYRADIKRFLILLKLQFLTRGRYL